MNETIILLIWKMNNHKMFILDKNLPRIKNNARKELSDEFL